MGLYDNQYKAKNDDVVNAIKNKKEIFRNLIKKKVDTFDENKLEGFVDHMIFNSNKSNEITFDMILDDIGTVFTAGTDTTASCIEACIYNLCLYNNFQLLMTN